MAGGPASCRVPNRGDLPRARRRLAGPRPARGLVATRARHASRRSPPRKPALTRPLRGILGLLGFAGTRALPARPPRQLSPRARVQPTATRREVGVRDACGDAVRRRGCTDAATQQYQVRVRAAAHAGRDQAAADRERRRLRRASSSSAGLHGAVRRLAGRRFWQDGYLWQPFTLHVAARTAPRPHRCEHARALDVRLAARDGLGPRALPALLPDLRRRRGAADRDAGPALPVLARARRPGHATWMPTLGASGAIYGVLLAYSLTWPDRTIMLIFPPIAVPRDLADPVPLPDGVPDRARRQREPRRPPRRRAGGLAAALPRRAADARLRSRDQLKHRWRRYRMRRRLRAVRDDESSAAPPRRRPER